MLEYLIVCVCVIQSKKGFVIVSGGIADRLIVILMMQFIISSYRPKIPICTALQESNLCAQCTAEAIKSVQEMLLPNSLHLLPCSPMFTSRSYSASFRITLHYLLPLLSSFLLVHVCLALSFLFANKSRGLIHTPFCLYVCKRIWGWVKTLVPSEPQNSW